jgi:hypothetical protein
MLNWWIPNSTSPRFLIQLISMTCVSSETMPSFVATGALHCSRRRPSLSAWSVFLMPPGASEGERCMANELTAERVAILAAAARVQLDAATAGRVARAVSPMVGRFSAPDIVVPFEVEPATFVVVQHRDARR